MDDQYFINSPLYLIVEGPSIIVFAKQDHASVLAGSGMNVHFQMSGHCQCWTCFMFEWREALSMSVLGQEPTCTFQES